MQHILLWCYCFPNKYLLDALDWVLRKSCWWVMNDYLRNRWCKMWQMCSEFLNTFPTSLGQWVFRSWSASSHEKLVLYFESCPLVNVELGKGFSGGRGGGNKYAHLRFATFLTLEGHADFPWTISVSNIMPKLFGFSIFLFNNWRRTASTLPAPSLRSELKFFCKPSLKSLGSKMIVHKWMI